MAEQHTPKAVAGESAILARRYAVALFELAQEQKVVDDVASDLKVLREAIDSDPHFHSMASHPRLPSQQVAQVVKAVTDAAQFKPLTAAFLGQVARNRRMALVPEMIEAYLVDLAAMRGQFTAIVTSAQPLAPEQQEKLAAQLGKMTGGTVQIIARQDPSLLGGLVVKVGSRLIDASVKGKLAQVERQLKSQQEAA